MYRRTLAPAPPRHTLRSRLVLGLLLLLFALLAGRAAWVQVWNKEFLQAEGQQRHQRQLKISAVRGKLLDRNGAGVAVSTPVDSVWMHPGEVESANWQPQQWMQLAQRLDLAPHKLQARLERNRRRSFVYLKRHLTPAAAAAVSALGLDGIYLHREYRRYYPLGAGAAHVLGFTDIDGNGLEGLELAFDRHLRGADGSKIELRDMRGSPVESVSAQPVANGADIRLSIDARLQKLAHGHLREAVVRHKAVGGTLVLMDVLSGEVLAMTTAPGFNPNNLQGYSPEVFRNRAVTDVFEPGSVIKTFVIAGALHSGVAQLNSVFETAPGSIKVGAKTINDVRNYGRLTLPDILIKSSNVGIVQVADLLPPGVLRDTLDRFGFGSSTNSGLPGEVSGYLPNDTRQHTIEYSSLSYGYGVSVTALQVTGAYAALANDGVMVPVTLRKREAADGDGNGDSNSKGRRVLAAPVARQLRAIMEEVVLNGTARRARIERYRVAAKTGTVRKYIGGYDEDRYMAVLVGFAPASRPRLVMTVVVDDPRGDSYYGGVVAGPIFREVMSRALRLMDIPPDNLPAQRTATPLASAESGT